MARVDNLEQNFDSLSNTAIVQRVAHYTVDLFDFSGLHFSMTQWHAKMHSPINGL